MTRLTFSEGAHRYYLADPVTGRKRVIPSVSGVLKPDGRDWSDLNAQRVAEYAVDNWTALEAMPASQRLSTLATSHRQSLNAKAARGTAIHAMAEDLLAGRPVDVPDDLVAPVRGLAAWWGDSGMTRVAAEAMVWADDDPEVGACAYAGTLDLLAHDRHGRLWLLDVKTGSGVWPEFATQLVAYASAQWIVVDGEDRHMTPVQRLGVLHVRPDGTSLHYLSTADRRLTEDRWSLLLSLRAADRPEFRQSHGVPA